ncbi:class I SAM-dependent methyltransferase [Sphingomonas naphthae]|uniref:Class I SAM-dependent methyltransferase n=1 Tax=Sphingomonas naphthae TaxID=1813468 RepID=A0ABY7TNN1_9SPHN|nr:class I SAM-dependent methyltransferase [Sphingomonas naphthae]WCT74842.1 class I SAM-dependent methyltransferase [Sphingomonas naphthae]
MKKPLSLANIGDLVDAVDKLGGDASKLNLEFESLDLNDILPLDPTIDPFSEEYVDYQIRVYKAISNRGLDQSANEHTSFDYRTHFSAANPYASTDVVQMARHMSTISSTIIRAGLPPSPRILDMGCGWGLSTEILSFLGASVTSVDINQDFINLVKDRCSRHGYGVNVIHSGFDEITEERIGSEAFEAVFFYECLHHAVRPWRIIEQMGRVLAPNGKLMLTGEPIQDIWWPAWGIRLDPLSVYCIHQFGWFESGWSRAFLAEMANRAGFNCEFIEESAIGSDPIFIGTKTTYSQQFTLDGVQPLYGWDIAESGWTSLGSSVLKISAFDEGDTMTFDVWNYRPTELHAAFTSDGKIHEFDLQPGLNQISIKAATIVTIAADVWSPAAEINNDDKRLISFTINKATLVSATAQVG